MAKQDKNGIMGSYRGTVGPVIGYLWRGRWCVRSKPRSVGNPRTEAQQKQRILFREMVQLAGHMTAALRHGMRGASLEERMTEGNLFVRLNKECFTQQGVDYASLVVAVGPVAPVAFTRATVDAAMVVHVDFERNSLQRRCSGDDEVRVYAYCPALQQGVLSAAVYRRSMHLDVALPSHWARQEWHLYGFVEDYAQRASGSQYITVTQNDDVPVEANDDTSQQRDEDHRRPDPQPVASWPSAGADSRQSGMYMISPFSSS